MKSQLSEYANVAGEDVIGQLHQLAIPLKGKKVLHINSTKEGGGVAEILYKLIPFERELGIDATWEVIQGGAEFYKCTKGFHNALQGNQVVISDSQFQAYEKANEEYAEKNRDLLKSADIVFIHDPQPAPLLRFTPDRKGKWIWRCHIDASHPYRPVWKYLRDFVSDYDASIFSLPDFAQSLPHPQYLIPPSIDPLSEKNIALSAKEINTVFSTFNLDSDRPIMTQVSRFDRFKDPVGVIAAFRLAKKFSPIQLVLAGGGASDDPEGEAVLQEVETAANNDPDIHILLLPPDAHKTINALQRASDIIVQKSIKEGFGLTVTEGLWKGKPVIGGNTGGIRLQVVNHHTGFLVDTPEGAALRIRYLLHNKDKLLAMGKKAKEFVRENFLTTRLLREHLTLMVGLIHKKADRIELDWAE